MTSDFNKTLRICVMILAGITAAIIAPRQATADWFLDVAADLDLDLQVYRASGSGDVTIDPVRDGARADFGFGNSIPVNWIFQDWNGSEWPATDLLNSQTSPDLFATAEGFIQRSSLTSPFPEVSTASIFGELNSGINMGAATAFDFTLNIDANTLAVVELFEAFASIEASNAAPGFGFAGVRLYDPTANINDPNGVNSPYSHDFISLVDDGMAEQQLSLFAEFDNLNNSNALTLDMRVEIYTVAFTSVPEPGSLIAFGVLGCLIGIRRVRYRNHGC